MTSIVGILCADGVVIGSDSSATFGPAPGHATIEQRYDDKVLVINSDIIVATTGQVGLAQRFEAIVEQVSQERIKKPKSYADVAKAITSGTLSDFKETQTQKLELSAFAGGGAIGRTVAEERRAVEGRKPLTTAGHPMAPPPVCPANCVLGADW